MKRYFIFLFPFSKLCVMTVIEKERIMVQVIAEAERCLQCKKPMCME